MLCHFEVLSMLYSVGALCHYDLGVWLLRKKCSFGDVEMFLRKGETPDMSINIETRHEKFILFPLVFPSCLFFLVRIV